MEARRRKSCHDLVRTATRLPSSEGDQILGHTDLRAQRRMSLDQASDHGLAKIAELIDTMDSLYFPPIRRSSTTPQVKSVSSSPRRASLKVSGGRALRRARSSMRVVYFKESFYEVYGYLGLVMLLAFTLSLLAMVYMTVVQVFPNWTANFLMGTDTLDNGEFLLMSKPSLTIVVTSTVMLSVFACLYLWLIVFMLSYNSESTVNNLSQAPDPKSLSYRLSQKLLPFLRRLQAQTGGVPRQRTASIGNASSRVRSLENLKSFSAKIQRTSSFGSHAASKLIFDFTSMEGTYHRYYDALLDFPKLILQTMSLTTYLSKGFPLPIIFFYVLPLGFNWLISFYRFQRTKPDPMLVVARVFYLFDLFFAVFAPIVMLMYSYYNFHVDRDNFVIREETLTPGSFDRIARLFADPIQVQLVKTSFANLQITEGEYILVKCFLNLLGIYKWKKVIAYLILANRSRREDKGVAKARAHPHSRKHTMVGGFIFICCSMGIAIYTALSISTSIENCAPYQHCPVYSYRWDWGHKSTCRCIVFMDLDLAPRTYNDWINAPDVTEDLRALSSNGYLQIVQIINRAVPELPEELRLCTKLKELILIYTKTRRFPEWMKEFTRLEYFHVENDLIHSSLQYLPPDTFSNMHNLRFLRTGGATALTEYPSLAGLHKLSTLVLTIVHNLKELPNLDDLSGLTTLYIADAIHAYSLPSLVGLTNLKNFALFRRNEICCNGWATGYCDLTNFQCLPRENEPTVQCVNDRIPAEDLAVIDRVDGFLCRKNITQNVQASEPTLQSTDGMCQGVLYRECNMNGIRGICYNGRMQVVHCDVFGEYEKMRRLQIARGVGERCDPKEETWLGCS
ncbi:hypothetical protein PC116_g23929 [Phytophthora cactorum]|uniref:WLGC domain-containing protein n=1 Tax=Phytophthora cactorum TaxID=29920 RepID=A0A329SVX3_9STRA|nr:hypothetical protein PC113_g19779 [Phytophthora cactorum]KAG2902090.1 hypothetical protein PC117_g21562 [Phytophthora cactorum]KAG2965758.1 hypothetical protein PC118_g19568 [Phytophthora cactorum]KAG3134554.1 hypothetical protein C6341_g22110 [Phytophthora cactorum]KAG4227688.1 hypothetical protein PC116_g23929 [Phytophthora cactorum]